MRVAHDKSQGILEKSAQRAFKNLRCHRSCRHERQFPESGRLLPRTAEKSAPAVRPKKAAHSGQIEISIASGEVQILQQAQLFCVDIREVTVIPLFKNPGTAACPVCFINARLCGRIHRHGIGWYAEKDGAVPLLN